MHLPETMPELTPGRHRNPRKGACLMELTSVLSGEPWSDHPRGTHPLLGEVARTVNDLTGDRARQRLALLAPDLAGLCPRDPRAAALVARTCALAALAAAPRKGYAAAVGLLHAEAALAEAEGRPPQELTPAARRALARLDPDLRHRAEELVASWSWQSGDFASDGAPAIVRNCLSKLAGSELPDPDEALVELLERLVVLCRDLSTTTGSATVPTTGSARMSRCTPRSSSSPDRRGRARAGSRVGSASRR